MPETPTLRADPGPARSRRTLAVGATLAALVLGLGAFARPAVPDLAAGATGDSDLAAAVREAAAGVPARRMAVATVQDGTATFAGFDADERTVFEIGSVSKALTGLLLADAVERGEITLDDRLGAHLPQLDDAAAGDVTLASLATHTSGLPRLASGWGMIVRNLWWSLSGANPYDGIDIDAVVAATAGTRVRQDAEPRYSNLGAALAGQALAAHAGVPYERLLRERLTGPLGMTRTTAPTAPPADDPLAPGTDASGQRQEPWVLDGYAPAGGVRSTTGDLALLLTAVLDGTVVGAEALEPRADHGDGDRVGLFWITSTTPDGRTVSWHNGRTGGYAAWIGVDRAAGRGVVVLSDVSASVDDVGRQLLEVAP